MNAGSITGKIELDPSGVKTGMAAAVTEAKRGAATLSETLDKPFAAARDANGRFMASLGDTKREVEQLGNEGRKAGSALSSLLATAAGTALGTMFTSAVSGATSFASSLVGVAVQGVKLAAQAESTSLAMKTMIGDADAANSLLKDLRTFANSTPFEFPELANAAKQLLAMGIDSKNIVSSLRMIGDVSSGLGQPIGEMAYLFGQIRSQGRAMTQDLNQFAGRGVPIYGELAKVLKTDELGVRALAETGQISFAKIEAAFASMTAAGGQFYNMTASQAETAQGLMSTLEDSIGDVEKQIGDALTTGTDGKTLIKEITAEVDKLKPSVVSLGVSLAEAFKNALPALKTTADYLQVILDKIGLIDLNKINGNPYDAAPAQKIDAIREAANTPETYAGLDKIQAGVSKGAADAAAALKELSKWTTHDAGLEGFSANVAARISESDKFLAQLRDLRAKGQTITDEQFQAAKDNVAGSLKGLGLLQEAINKAQPDLQDLKGLHGEASGQQRAGAALTKIRAASMGAQREVDELMKEAAARKTAADDDAKRKQLGEWTNGTATSGPEKPTPSAAGGSSTGGGAGRQAGGFDLAKMTEDAKVAQLEAAGKQEQAALLKAQQQRDRDYARINAQSDSGEVSISDSVKGSLAIKSQYESAVAQIQKRFAKQRQDELDREAEKARATSERVEEYMTQEAVAGLKERNETFEAELLAFDAGWKRRIDNAKTAEERYSATVAYEAERRVKIREEEQRQAKGAVGTIRGVMPALTRQPTVAEAGRSKATSAAMADLSERESAGQITPAEQTRLDRLREDARLKPFRYAVKGAKQGSGEREAARLDLRSALSKTLSSDEARRRKRLADRFGAGSAMQLPSPLDGLNRALMPPGRRQPAAGSQPAQVSVTPTVSVDGEKIAKLCVEAIRPVIREEIQRTTNALRDRAHAANTGANL